VKVVEYGRFNVNGSTQVIVVAASNIVGYNRLITVMRIDP
jgi:hypothetical protein